MVILILGVLLQLRNVIAQEVVATCYSSGSIVGAIIGTLLITLGFVGAAVLVHKVYWRSRKGKHLVLVTDAENPPDEYAFDNPGFREATPIKQTLQDEKLSKSWLSNWSPLQTFSTIHNEKLRSLDDSFMSDSHLKVVSLKSYDFTGLGFTVCGNMRDGIFVKDLLHRGPAFESGRISPGDRIDSVCISFRHMVFEDALTILSYASPYEVQVQVEHNPSRPSTLIRNKREANSNNSSGADRIRHPFYRSQSIADLAQIGRSNMKRGNHSAQNSISDKNNKDSSDYSTLKLQNNSPKTQKLEKQTSGEENMDGKRESTDTASRLHKLGIKVLPVSLNSKIGLPKSRDNNENQPIDHVDGEGHDVKAFLTKQIQNIKEKINQNSLGRKKKEEEEISRGVSEAARNNLAAKVEDTLSTSSTESNKVKKSKGKAPPPPVKDSPPKQKEELFEPVVSVPEDSDSEIEVKTHIELNSTQITVHQSPKEEESGRKAASLGDLSRIDAENSLSLPLERAVSLDLDASHSGKKRKAPTTPEELTAPFDALHKKEPRLEEYNTFQRKLKKSSDFGTLEDALQTEENPIIAHIEEVNNLHIQEFSTWLEECRKPQKEQENSLIVVNGDSGREESIPDFRINGEIFQEQTKTVLVISQPNSLETEEAFITANESTLEETIKNEEDEKIPDLPTTPMPTLPSPSSLTYITEINVSNPEVPEVLVSTSTPRPAKSPRKDETSKIPIRTMKSETGQRVLATIQSLAQENAKASGLFDSPPSVAGYQLKKTPPAVPIRRDIDWNKDVMNGSSQSGVNLPVKTSATKIVFESKDVENEHF